MDEEITIRDVMTREYVGVSESDTIRQVAEVMLQDGVSGVVVLRGNDVEGVVTDRDLLSALIGEALDVATPVGEVMRDPGPTVSADVPVAEAFTTLTADDVDHLLVMHRGEIAGMVSARDLVLASASLVANQQAAVTTTGEAAFDTRERSDETDEYSTQSVCEVCGSFAPELHNINGQLVCDDCRSV